MVARRDFKQGWGKLLLSWVLISVVIRAIETIFVIIPSTPLIRLSTNSVIVGLAIGMLQWLVIRNLISERSYLWIAATWVGYVLTAVVSITPLDQFERAVSIRSGFTEYDRVVLIIYMYWLLEALLVGMLQSLVMKRWLKFGWRWILILSGAIALEYTIMKLTQAMAMTFMGLSLLGLVMVSFVILLSSAGTGMGLLWLLQNENVEVKTV